MITLGLLLSDKSEENSTIQTKSEEKSHQITSAMVMPEAVNIELSATPPPPKRTEAKHHKVINVDIQKSELLTDDLWYQVTTAEGAVRYIRQYFLNRGHRQIRICSFNPVNYSINFQ